LIGDGGLPVGLIEGAEFGSETVMLHPGDRLLVYSDGLTECADGNGDFLGEEGLIAALSNLRGLSGPDSLKALVAMVEEFHGPRPFEDDISAALVDISRRKANP
jgi:sigma-B regulation protein RsbU (phosphoserine phosphatase)